MLNALPSQINQAPDRPPLRLLTFKAVRKGTLRGFASVKLPIGLVINDIPVNQAGNGKAWAMLPGKPMVDRDGNLVRDDRGHLRYSPVVEWGTSELRETFSQRVVGLVRAEYPEALDATVAP